MRTLGIIQRARSWINRGIQRRLVFWSIGFWVVAVSTVSLAFMWVGQSEILRETRQRNVQIASVVSRDVNSQVASIFSDIRIFPRHLEVLSPGLDSQAAAILALRLSSPQRYRAVYYFDSNNNLILHLADTLESLLALKDVSDIVSRPPVPVDGDVVATYRAAKGATTFVSDVHFAGIDRVPVVYVGMPITLSGGDARVVVLQLDLRDIWQRIDLSMIGESGLTYAVSRKGTIIAHPDPAYLGRRIPPEIEPLLAGFEGFTEYTEAFKRRAVFAAYSPVGGSTGWGIVMEQDESEAHAPILRTGIFVISAWLALAAVGTFGILVMMRNFARPVVELTRVAQTIALTGKLAKTSMEQRPDEVGQLSQSFDLMIERLQTTEGKLATAAADERSRLARDLHDAVTQTLFSASLIAEVLPRLWERNQDEGRRRIEELRQLTRGALAEMRTLLIELRPGALTETDLGTLLRQLTEAVSSRTRLAVNLAVDCEQALPPDVQVALYRIAQEALNNVTKHSGASQVTVSLRCRGDGVELYVRDNGRGFDPSGVSPEHLGLGIMGERAKAVSAAVTIESQPKRGAQVTVVWPACPHEEQP